MRVATSVVHIHRCSVCRRHLINKSHSIVYAILICQFLELLLPMGDYHLHILLLIVGDVETNPGPQQQICLRFFHWNLNSICDRGHIKILLIEAYNSVRKFDVIALSETMLDDMISNEDVHIEGFSSEVYRSDHPSNTKTGGVCLYFREGLAIKRRQDLEIIQEMVVSEMCIARKKIFFVVLYRSPSQNSAEFENFIDRLQLVVTRIQNENPYSLTITGDFNCRSSQWWSEDIENLEGSFLDEVLYVNNLH